MCVHAWMAVFLKDSHLPKVACTCFKVHMCMGGSICVLCWIVSRCGNLYTCTFAFFLTVEGGIGFLREVSSFYFLMPSLALSCASPCHLQEDL